MTALKIIALLKALLLPPAGFLLLGMAGLLIRQRKSGGFMIAISLCGLFLFSMPVFVNFIARSWETIPALQHQRVTQLKPQAIVVLGGGMKKSGQEYGRKVGLAARTWIRLHYAASVARETGLPILLAGGRVLDNVALSEAELMADYLHRDYQLEARWLETESRNTFENARNSHAILAENNIQRIILVTQAYHMPRALIQFEKFGLMVLPAPTDFIFSAEPWGIFSFIPSASALQKSFLLTHEWLGFYWYQLRYV
ncbi:YdcF family protein [Methylomarinum sp. Ch1-1]|uniref:YdcF family protein n=1 Tax=Methylomarinum roseum TaxID=3067653 RepID=A0AAU7NQI5_9GAMM|nr:YdcF family protein [Methylomarinum sp. Ch1-1]MDP4520806.1 YdcF family protein [Methylomarinum sp. Ch1-1]